MGVTTHMNSLPKNVTRQRRDCDLNPGPSAPESSTLTTRLPKIFDKYLSHYERQTLDTADTCPPHFIRNESAENYNM